MSLLIDELSSLYGLYGVNNVSSNSGQSENTGKIEEAATDGDSYVSTIAGLDPDTAIPSDTYNDLARKIKSASGSSENTNATEYASVEDSLENASQSVGGSGGAGGGGSSDSEEETETEIVTIDGRTYLQTTTTDANGNTTVTRKPIGVASPEASGETSTLSVGAEALTSL